MWHAHLEKKHGPLPSDGKLLKLYDPGQGDSYEYRAGKVLVWYHRRMTFKIDDYDSFTHIRVYVDGKQVHEQDN